MKILGVTITAMGVIVACKNVGLWLTSYGLSGIKADPYQFGYSFIIYALISIPSDLLLLNHATTQAEKKVKENGNTDQ